MNILYEDTALVVLDKPAGLTSEEGVPAALRQRWGRPDAYVGVIHRLDTGVSGLMVYARTPGAAAALTKQVTERFRQRLWQSERKFLATIQTIRWRIRLPPIM